MRLEDLSGSCSQALTPTLKGSPGASSESRAKASLVLSRTLRVTLRSSKADGRSSVSVPGLSYKLIVAPLFAPLIVVLHPIAPYIQLRINLYTLPNSSNISPHS